MVADAGSGGSRQFTRSINFVSENNFSEEIYI